MDCQYGSGAAAFGLDHIFLEKGRKNKSKMEEGESGISSLTACRKGNFGSCAHFGKAHAKAAYIFYFVSAY